MRKIILFILVILFAVLKTEAYAYWLWTPKTGKWENPKASLKRGSAEQLAFAVSLYKTKDYKHAKREFAKLLKAFPKSSEAAESQYYLGVIEEDQGNLYKAYKAYQKVVDKYPFSERIKEVIEHEYNIAERIMTTNQKKGKMAEVFAAENHAIEIFTKVIENSNYGPLAAKAQYKLGLIYEASAQYYDAEDAFSKVISKYPDSEWVEAAKFKVASCRRAVSRGPDYDQVATREARVKFEEFLRGNPDAALSKDAEKNIIELKEKEAESNFKVASFYEKQKDYGAAKIYYQDIVDNYPESKWFTKAQTKLQVINKNYALP